MKKNQLSVFIIMISLSLVGLVFLMGTQLASAGALPQTGYQTPTPNQEGQIIYTVQEGDTCTRIFLLTGVTIEEIVALNDLDDDCEIFPTQELILATGLQMEDTPEAPDTEPITDPDTLPDEPTPIPFEGNGEVCVALYEDLDGNQMRAREERYLAGGVVSISNRAGTFSETRETVGGDPALVDPVCFEDVPEGDYNLSMAIPEGYNPTTSMNYALTVSPGDTIVVDFGAQPGSQMINSEDPVLGGGRSPLLLAIGLFLLAGGAGLAFFFIRSRLET
jgi:LysM repeat protein